jgi:hypothetical protein
VSKTPNAASSAAAFFSFFAVVLVVFLVVVARLALGADFDRSAIFFSLA